MYVYIAGPALRAEAPGAAVQRGERPAAVHALRRHLRREPEGRRGLPEVLLVINIYIAVMYFRI